MNGVFQLEACVRSKVWSYAPLVTPSGKPGNAGTGVATPVLLGAVMQQWICAMVVLVVRPANTTLTRSVWAVVSRSAKPDPVAGEVFGGFSLAPLRRKKNRVGAASLTEAIMN